MTEGGKEENDDAGEVRREKEVMNAVRTANLVESILSDVLTGDVEKTNDVERSSSCVLTGEFFLQVVQSWDWSQAVSESEEIRWIGS